VRLAAGEVLRIPAPRGLEVACEAGHLWITEEGMPDDVWLGPGQRVVTVQVDSGLKYLAGDLYGEV